MNYRIYPLGDRALAIHWDSGISESVHDRVMRAMVQLETDPFEGFVECVPSYSSLTVYYDPVQVNSGEADSPYRAVCRQVGEILKEDLSEDRSTSRLIEIPVCYEDEYAPDLAYVAEYNGMSPQEVVHLHSSVLYRVFMIGFVPGFPYLGGMDRRIATPRRSFPRSSIQPGSVGIAGGQTGIYPMESPGGWQIIGRTPLKLFDPAQHPPSLLQAGDRVQFCPIPRNEFADIRGEASK